MIKRETYMRRIRPFIGSELVKVMTGIRRCGKSVMLELIKEELKNSGVPEANIISINFEDMRYAHLLTAKALHDEIIMRAQNISGKVYLFFDEIQEVADWEKCINSFRRYAERFRIAKNRHCSLVADRNFSRLNMRKFFKQLDNRRVIMAEYIEFNRHKLKEMMIEVSS